MRLTRNMISNIEEGDRTKKRDGGGGCVCCVCVCVFVCCMCVSGWVHVCVHWCDI